MPSTRAPLASLAMLVALARPTTTIASRPGPGEIDTRDAAARITVMAAARAAAIGVKAGKAECPRPFPWTKPTAVFQCTVPYEGVQVPYLVRLDLASGVSTIEPMAAVIPTRALVSAAGPSGSKVDCGRAKVLVRPVGSVVDCTITVGSGRKAKAMTVEVRIADAEGTVVGPGGSIPPATQPTAGTSTNVPRRA